MCDKKKGENMKWEFEKNGDDNSIRVRVLEKNSVTYFPVESKEDFIEYIECFGEKEIHSYHDYYMQKIKTKSN